MKWDLSELRGHVNRLIGEDQLRTFNQCRRTIGDRREFSQYHFNEAKIRMEDAFQSRETFELTTALPGGGVAFEPGYMIYPPDSINAGGVRTSLTRLTSHAPRRARGWRL
ncbi:hypothetical protein GGR64_000336 [Xanthomonas arboricola]|nr:hypothetical protein [Xanthomonas sp. 3307]